MNRIKKIIVLAVVLVIIVASSYLLFQPNNKTIPGYVSTDIRYISTEESGRLLELNVKEGQYVNKGTLLYSLNSNEKTSKQTTQPDTAKASTNIVSAKADLKYSKAELIRQKKLLKYNGTSKKDYQLAYSNYIKAKAKVDSATVKSTEAGYVYQIFYRPGEMVATFNPVISFINPNDVYIVFYISKDDLDKIHLGDKINLKTDTGNTSTATINYISKDAEYTPPLLYGINADSEISFEVKAKIKYQTQDSNIHIGEPVRVEL